MRNVIIISCPSARNIPKSLRHVSMDGFINITFAKLRSLEDIPEVRVHSRKCVIMVNVQSKLCVTIVFSFSTVTFLIYHERNNTSSHVLLSGVVTATKSGSLLKCFLSLTVLPIQFPQNRCFPWPEVCFPQHWSFDSIGLIKNIRDVPSTSCRQ